MTPIPRTSKIAAAVEERLDSQGDQLIRNSKRLDGLNKLLDGFGKRLGGVEVAFAKLNETLSGRLAKDGRAVAGVSRQIDKLTHSLNQALRLDRTSTSPIGDLRIELQMRSEYLRLLSSRLETIVAIDQPLVLVSQLPRSGGTLLSQLLDGHPQLFAHPFELYIGHPGKENWPELDLDAGSDEWYSTLSEMPAERAFWSGYRKEVIPSPEGEHGLPFLLAPTLQRMIFERCLESGAISSPRDILDCYMTSYFNAWLDYAGLHGGDKRWISAFLPRLHMAGDSLERFFRDYPDGRLLTIVRDPRGWYASGRAWTQRGRPSPNRQREFGDLDRAIGLWNESVECSLAAKERFTDRVLVLSFEALVGDTDREMRRVAEFLELDFDPVLLAPTFNCFPMRANSSFGVAGIGIRPEVLEFHLDELSKAEAARIEELSGDVFARGTEASSGDRS